MVGAVKTDLYEILGVSETASEDEIRKAYRELARKYHPDKTGGDKAAETRLKEINAAYGILKKADTRAEYDKRRKTGSFDGFEGFDFGAEGGDFSDILSQLFGGAAGVGRGARTRTRTSARPGNDLETRVRVTLAEIASGTKKTLRMKRAETCSECSGSGQVSLKPCAACSGSGRTQAQRELSVTIPAGADDGTRLRVGGEGEAGFQGGLRGDLYVRVELEPDPLFKRDGQNLVCEAPVTFAEAALGAKVTVPTLDGVAKLTLEPGTQSGAQLRMRGLGLPPLGGGPRGDEIVKVLVEVPKKLTEEQKRLLREFDGNYEPGSHTFRDAFRALLKRLRGAD